MGVGSELFIQFLSNETETWTQDKQIFGAMTVSFHTIEFRQKSLKIGLEEKQFNIKTTHDFVNFDDETRVNKNITWHKKNFMTNNMEIKLSFTS